MYWPLHISLRVVCIPAPQGLHGTLSQSRCPCCVVPSPSFSTAASRCGTPPSARIHDSQFTQTKWAPLLPVSCVFDPRKQGRSLPCASRPPLLVNSSLNKLQVLPPLTQEARTMCAQAFPIEVVSTGLWLLWGTFGFKGNGISPSIFFLDDRSVTGSRA